jgi:hypothetical protein
LKILQRKNELYCNIQYCNMGFEHESACNWHLVYKGVKGLGVHCESHYKGVCVCVLRYNLKVQNSYIVVRNDHVQTWLLQTLVRNSGSLFYTIVRVNRQPTHVFTVLFQITVYNTHLSTCLWVKSFKNSFSW